MPSPIIKQEQLTPAQRKLRERMGIADTAPKSCHLVRGHMWIDVTLACAEASSRIASEVFTKGGR